MGTSLPKLRVRALVHVVVQDDEVANAFKLKTTLGVVSVYVKLTEALVWEKLNQLSDTPKNYLIEAIGVDSSKPKSVMVKLNDSRILVIEARATAGLDKLQANQTGILVYVVDTSVPTIKGIAKTYSRANVDRKSVV